MKEFLNFVQNIFMIKDDETMKVGLTQFRRPVIRPVEKDVSIRNKDVKLSDLMRRAG
ncbi:MAG TPA: hypothetical protein PLG15_02645 [Candidatus Gastranaerophilaceae bacterium]|nr:hypothetical protein [Candidatus Gastranaerophilaceae bacterium]HPT41263.1 hypothetical protein [Candidatus Gastranaerophilaceae bacterium]